MDHFPFQTWAPLQEWNWGEEEEEGVRKERSFVENCSLIIKALCYFFSLAAMYKTRGVHDTKIFKCPTRQKDRFLAWQFFLVCFEIWVSLEIIYQPKILLESKLFVNTFWSHPSQCHGCLMNTSNTCFFLSRLEQKGLVFCLVHLV